VKSTLSAIPVHMSIVVCLSSWAIEAIDLRRRAFLWTGSDAVAAGRCRVAWQVVCQPRDLGGLGVADLGRLGIAFRVRWMWLERTAANSCEAGLPARHDKAVAAMFRVGSWGTENRFYFGMTFGLVDAASRNRLQPCSLLCRPLDVGGLSRRHFISVHGRVTLLGL
jgi:hypothetical protein